MSDKKKGKAFSEQAAELTAASMKKAAEFTNAGKKRAQELLKRLMPQIILQIVIIIATVIATYVFMTWLIRGVIGVTSGALAAIYEILGILVLMIAVLVSINTWVYRKRMREIETLSTAISQVANGAYDYRIPIRKKEPMVGVYEDFNKMTAELSGVQILRKDFINNYSHEFKTPVASINGFADLLLTRSLSPEEQQEYLTIIRDESGRLADLAKNSILLSRLSTQEIVDHSEEYDLGEQLRQCAIICSGNWTAKHQEFSGELPSVAYHGNRELMQHLWLNLLNNAIKYTDEGGSISVELSEIHTEDDQSTIRVVIEDTGEGMSEETKAHLFDPYYQGDASRSVQGLGLGLAIVHRIVELCGGTITVESELGKGSAFTVMLPERVAK